MKKIISAHVLFIIFVSFFFACDNKPLFTELNTSKLKIIIKGTYASHADTAPMGSSIISDDSIDDYPTYSGTYTFPTQFMLDIAEIRLGKDKVSTYRQAYRFDMNDSDDFFNGTGVELKTDDPVPGKYYDTVHLYIRQMVFDQALEFSQSSAGWVLNGPAETYFKEKDVEGFDFNQRMPNNHWDTLRENGDSTNRVFPIDIPIEGGFIYDKEDEETVLEIRILIKNFIELYEYDDYDENDYFVTHYFGVADWVHDVKTGEDDLGGNLIAVARAYVPEKAGTVTVTDLGGGSQYLLFVPENEDVNDYVLADTGENLRGNVDCDMPSEPDEPGEYVEQYLDYYLMYEEYKVKWYTEINDCEAGRLASGLDTLLDEYESDWDTYIDTYDNYSLPGIAVYATGTSVTVDNIPPGNYYIYKTGSIPAFGELYTTGFTAGKSGALVTITSGVNSDISFL